MTEQDRRSPWLSPWVIVAVIVVVSIAGLVIGTRYVADPEGFHSGTVWDRWGRYEGD